MASTFSQHRGRAVLIGLVLLHLAIISRQVDGGGGQSLLTRLILAALSPIQVSVAAVGKGISSLWTGYVQLRGARSEATRLETRVRELEVRLLDREQLASETERLRSILALRTSLKVDSVVGEVIARDGVPWARTLTLNKGRSDGVTLDAAVVSPAGVVGRVIALGPGAAKVQVLFDRSAGAGVVVERSRTPGVLGGPAGGSDAAAPDLVLNYIPALADVAEGDIVLTSGTDGIYPKGLPAGTVRSVRPASLFKDVVVAPSVRPESLDFVLVLLTHGRADSVFDESVR